MARRYRVLAFAVLALAAFNLTYRLGLESVEEWDESLYATTAWEMLRSGDPIATTFGGELDYYNSKPPLNVWLLGASFAVFGVNLVSLRVVSAASAWLTVLALQLWTRRIFGPTVSLLSSLVLATTFGFIHLHAGRSGNPDALMTLLILLTVITLSAAHRQPWQRAWLGPILAGVFPLKGMAVLMPLLLVLIVLACARRRRGEWKPLATAVLLFLVPTSAWAMARWQVDGWQFLNRISAETRSFWRLHVVTNLKTSVQGVLLSKRHDFRGTRVSRDRLHRGEAFIVRAMMNTDFHVMTGANHNGAPRSGDLYIFSREIQNERLRPVGSADGHFIYEAP